MNTLTRLQKTKPRTNKIDLSFAGIEEIDSLVGELYQFKNLETLNLSGNRISQLPDDLSILKTIKNLDLSHNAFIDKVDLYSSLATMPSLETLKITLSSSDEPEALRYLPN